MDWIPRAGINVVSRALQLQHVLASIDAITNDGGDDMPLYLQFFAN